MKRRLVSPLGSVLLVILATVSLSYSQTTVGQPISAAIYDSEKSVPPIPLVTGGISFTASFESGTQDLHPVVSPIFLIPIGRHALIEAEFEAQTEAIHDSGGFAPVHLDKSLEYAQLDYFVSKYLTIVAGRFPTPFGFYKERLDARWIRNLAEPPLIFPFSDTSNNGGMLRGAIPLKNGLQLGYSTYFSAACDNLIAGSNRQTGFRSSVFVPATRLELGFSFNRQLGDQRFNSFGSDLTWNLTRIPLDFRSEALFSHTLGNGYWIEGAWRLARYRLPRLLRNSQVVLRGEQYFTPSEAPLTDVGLPGVDTSRVSAGWNYYFTNSLRAGFSYGRQFAQDDNHNTWTVGINYRFIM
jgi:hypothetical protein